MYCVRCTNYHSGDKAVCGRRYTCGKKAFYKGTNGCPECGSHKAQWISPSRTMKKKPDEGDK